MPLATLVLVFGVVLAGFGAAIALMAFGQRASGRCMRGSCGGPAVIGADGERLSCADCPNRDKAAADTSDPHER